MIWQFTIRNKVTPAKYTESILTGFFIVSKLCRFVSFSGFKKPYISSKPGKQQRFYSFCIRFLLLCFSRLLMNIKQGKKQPDIPYFYRNELLNLQAVGNTALTN